MTGFVLLAVPVTGCGAARPATTSALRPPNTAPGPGQDAFAPVVTAAPRPDAGAARRGRRARRVLRRTIAEMGARDPTVCLRRFTAHYLIKVTHERGAAATRRCAQDVLSGDREYRIVRLGRAVDGGGGHLLVRATVRSLANGQRLDGVYDLVTTSHGLRIDDLRPAGKQP